MVTFVTSSLATGSASISASYGGDSNYTSSSSSAVSQTVNQSSTSTSLTASANPVLYGQVLTLSASVAPVSPGAGTPTGSVTFYDGSTSLGSGSLNSSDVATMTVSTLTAGSNNITATHGGDGNFDSSTSSGLSETVNKAVPTVAVTDAGGVYDHYEYPASATVTGVSGPGGSSLEGVSITLAYYYGSILLSEAPYTPGTYTALASFAGSADYTSASAQTTFTISPPTVTFTSPGNQADTDESQVWVNASAADSAGDPVMYTAANLPDGLGISPTTGIISGNVADGANAFSPYTVTVTATDSIYNAATASESFQWTVDPYVTLAHPGGQANADGDTVTLTLDSSDTGTTPTFSASNLPPGLSIDSTSGVISGTISAGADSGSPYSVTVSATDVITASQTFQWTVSSSSSSTVSLTNPGNQTNNEEDNVDLTLSATPPPGDSLTFGALNLPPGLSIDSSTGVISGAIEDPGRSPRRPNRVSDCWSRKLDRVEPHPESPSGVHQGR